VTLDFGAVPYGYHGAVDLMVINTGTGPCGFTDLELFDCEAGFIFGGSPCESPSPSSMLSIEASPAPGPEAFPPGVSVPITVELTAPDEYHWIPKLELFPGLYVLHYSEQWSSPGTSTAHELPPPPSAYEDYAVNIEARVGLCRLVAMPHHVDFGAVPVGCAGPTREVLLYGGGTGYCPVTSIALEGCDGDVLLGDLPSLQTVVHPGETMAVSLTYAPSSAKADACTLVVMGTDPQEPLDVVPIEGEGTLDQEHEDSFSVAGPMVDVLFVIDSSGSMIDDVSRLTEAMDVFFDEALAVGADYHVGVVDVGIEEACYESGTLKGEPPVIASATGGSPFKVPLSR